MCENGNVVDSGLSWIALNNMMADLMLSKLVEPPHSTYCVFYLSFSYNITRDLVYLYKWDDQNDDYNFILILNIYHGWIFVQPA